MAGTRHCTNRAQFEPFGLSVDRSNVDRHAAFADMQYCQLMASALLSAVWSVCGESRVTGSG